MDSNEGWACPKCGRVYSPTTPMCFYCPLQTVTATGTTITTSYPLKYKEIMDIKSPSKCFTCKHLGDMNYCSNCHSDHSLFEEIDMRKGSAE